MLKRALILLAVLLALSQPIIAQLDPDSVLAEYLDTGEWEAVSLNPDLLLEWLSEIDSMNLETSNTLTRRHLLTAGIPVGASVFDWVSDSGKRISPVNIKYRIRLNEPHRWEFRSQVSQTAGDSCLVLPATGIPEKVCAGFLIRPGNLFEEIILGDYQINMGYGVVVGSSPVFSISLGNPGMLQRQGKGFRLHSGTSDSRFLRGMAGKIAIGTSEWFLFGSGKDQTQEGVSGVGWKSSFSNMDIGFSAIQVHDQYPPAAGDEWAAAWQSDSGRYSRLGACVQRRFRFGILFGEMGWSPNHGTGQVVGFRWFESHGFSAVIRYSGCSPGYPVTYTLFQSGTKTTKEGQRFLATLRYSTNRSWEWLGSVQEELSRWPGSNARFNNALTRITQQLKYVSNNQWAALSSVQLDFLESAGEKPAKLTWKMGFDSDTKQEGLVRIKADFRQQLAGFGEVLTAGTSAGCSAGVALDHRKVRISTGFRLFTVDSGADPLYAYEQDVLYGWSAPVLSGSGTRWFAMIQWKTTHGLNIECKVVQTGYSDYKHLTAGNSGGLSGKLQIGWTW